MVSAFRNVREQLGEDYPATFLILGNDDPRCEEPVFIEAEGEGLWRYMHGRKTSLSDLQVYGYSCVPPTPFLLKDWERYDVSRYVSPGCVSPEEGRRTVPVPEQVIKWGTIKEDLAELVDDDPLERAVFLLHTPPHETPLDRAALDGRMIEHVPIDVHVGSIAVRRFIEERQPLLTLHGHVHESAQLTGEWKIQIGRTVCINAAHDGPELALVRFSADAPCDATRELL
jgi:Icc-related predicted phosphoesterase